MKTLISFCIVFLLIGTVQGQSPDRWRGLVIDEATPAKAIEVLGTPAEDKTDSFRVYKIDKWLTSATRDKVYRRLEFKNVPDFDKVILAFKDDKLVFIELNPKKLSPNVLEGAYGIQLKPAFSKVEMSMTPGNFERDEGEVRAKKFPVFYYLIGVAPRSFLVAGVANSSIGSLLGSKAVNDGLSFPGKVEQLQIVSRTLENRDNVDTLK